MRQTHMHYRVRYARDGTIILLPREEEIAFVVREEVPVVGSIQDDRGEETATCVSRRINSPANAPKAYKPQRRKRPSQPRCPILRDAARFTGTFVAVFLFLFVSLNAGSYWQIVRAMVLPERVEEERRALEAMVVSRRGGDASAVLPVVPNLPAAGPAISSFLTALAVAPPDNRIVIPKIGKNIPLVEVSDAALLRGDWRMFEKDVQHALRFGAVRYPGTAEPGQAGNVFITAHSSYNFWDWGKYKDVFALLPSLNVGDEYAVYYKGRIHRYRITDKFEVSPTDVSVLDQPRNRRMSTIMTCVPVGTTLRRLILQADEIDPATGAVIAVEDERTSVVIPKVQWSGELAE